MAMTPKVQILRSWCASCKVHLAWTRSPGRSVKYLYCPQCMERRQVMSVGSAPLAGDLVVTEVACED